MDSDAPTNFEPSRPRRPRRTVPAYLVSRLISSYIGYLLVMGVLVLLVPNFEGAFKDEHFKLQPPLATLWLLKVSRLCVKYYLWVVLLPVPALWALANFNIANRTRRRGLRLSAFIFVAAFLIFTLLALFLPMTHLLQPTTRATQK
jgi:type II secretory pathway component PulF